eukprot:11089495-Prorocentrum_lima.AAC.1
MRSSLGPGQISGGRKTGPSRPIHPTDAPGAYPGRARCKSERSCHPDPDEMPPRQWNVTPGG